MSRLPVLLGLVCLLLGLAAWPVKAALELTLTISESGQANLTGPAQLEVVVGELIPVDLLLVNHSSSSVAVKPAACEPAGFELLGEPLQAPALTSTEAGLFLQDLNPLPHTAILRFEAASRAVEVAFQVTVSQPVKGPLFGATTRGLAYSPGFVDVEGNPWPADAAPKAGLIFKGYVPLSEAELAGQIALLERRRELPINLYLAELAAGWADVEPLQGQFYWERAEATVSLLTEKAGALSWLLLEYPPAWTSEIPNPDGTTGFITLSNEELAKAYQEYLDKLIQKMGSKVAGLMIARSPEQLWLPLFYEVNKLENPGYPALPKEHSLFFANLMGLLRRQLPAGQTPEIVAPAFGPAFWQELIALGASGKFDIAGHRVCPGEKLTGKFTPTAPPLPDPAGAEGCGYWRLYDEAADQSRFVQFWAARMGEKPWAVTELYGGFAGDTAAEALAGLRCCTILAHQGAQAIILGSTAAPDWPEGSASRLAFSRLTRALTGATPVIRPDTPQSGGAYFWCAWKTFTRGPEDLLTLWSNDSKPRTIQLVLTPEADIGSVRLERFSPVGQFYREELTGPRSGVLSIELPPLGFVILRATPAVPGLAWLERIEAFSEEEQAILRNLDQVWAATQRPEASPELAELGLRGLADVGSLLDTGRNDKAQNLLEILLKETSAQP